ncbi:energy-coupling factor transport system ATP-binding protein [Seinonella peptonophila]|uniref:Energy-coupling factor transport system ATP-binding protein n=1 Tax=Seinonella peptonophila TaxID=112248 RepID=A0A1M5B9E9_9BACL|nr:ABC transporter ATP-binding protein [Seinonella peptonophila]SHF39153.1 energy-coupling factor transport system ATP-binding protein [Seinonella peptonophila]
MSNFLEIKDLSFTYPNGWKALNNISIQIDRGERVAIIGQNGAGKTTLAKLMNGLNKPTSGDVTIDGWNTKEYTTAQISRKVGYVFQNPDDQIFHNTVFDEVAFGPKNLGQTEEEIHHNVHEATKLVEIHDFLKENPYDLPLSIRKFVTVASVIAMNPDVIILDEPTAGQDMKGLTCLASTIAELTKRTKTVITITHDMEFAASNFDRTIVMAHSNKIADGGTKEIFWSNEVLTEAGVKPPHISRLSKSLGIEDKGILEIKDLINYIKMR